VCHPDSVFLSFCKKKILYILTELVNFRIAEKSSVLLSCYFCQGFAKLGTMSSPSSNNGKEDAWLMRMELKAKEPKEVLMVAKDKEAAGDQAPAPDQALPEEEEDILLPYYEHLTPAEIEAFRMFEVTRVQNKYLTRVNILLEKHIVDLQGIIRRLQALVEAALSTPPPTPSSPKKET
jgi:hypothetical protein